MSNNYFQHHKWSSDASQIDVSKLDELIYQTNQIRQFIENHRLYFIAANKGMGKTLLLSLKRHTLFKEHTNNKSVDTKFIPVINPYLDFMNDIIDLNKNLLKFLSSSPRTKSLWKLAIRISILSHFELDFFESEQTTINKLPPSIVEWIINRGEVNPTLVFSQVLNEMTISSINMLIRESEVVFTKAIQRIHFAIYIFIDRVDQAISTLPKECWIAIQAGLIEAIWDIVSSNRHIKIYASIRQEAYGNFNTPVRSNLRNSTTILAYSKEELILLMNKLSNVYENISSFENFIAQNDIPSSNNNEPEDCFTYVYRHTIGRPRDFVIFANEFSTTKAQKELTRHKNINSTEFKSIVKKSGEENILANLFDESIPLLESLYNDYDRVRFLNLLNENILTKKEMFNIAYIYHNISLGSSNSKDIDKNYLLSPFIDLYKIGLLGVISQDEKKTFQKFKQPSERFDFISNKLPDSDYYFVHPIITAALTKILNNNHYVYENIIVGHTYPWNNFHIFLFEIQRKLLNCQNAQLTNMISEFLKKNFYLIKNNIRELKKMNEFKTLLIFLENNEKDSDAVDFHYTFDEYLKSFY